jgi:signal transduction histidine kinase/ligand-binding sensor domain-containing protein
MQRAPFGLALVLALFLGVPVLAADEPEPCDCHALTAWTTKDGLPSGNIMSMAQDRQGFLWLGMNGGGLVRFDGFQFSPWGAGGEPELPGNFIPALLSARDGSLWVGFGHSPGLQRVALVSRILDGRITTYTANDGLPGGIVAAIREDRQGTIWVAGSHGLAAFEGGRWRQAGQAEGIPEVDSFSLYVDRQGTLWVGTSAGVYTRKDGAAAFERYDATLTSVQSFAEDDAGRLWITGNQSVRTLPQPRGPAAQSAKLTGVAGAQLLHDGHGTIWLAALGAGLFQISPARTGATPHVERYNYEEHFNGPARSLFLDTEQNIWVGMRGGGLLRLSRTPVETDVPLDGLTNDGVRGLAATADGSVWVATGHSLNQFLNGTRRTYELEEPASIHAARNGDLWVASAEGIRRFANGRFDRLDLGDDARYQRTTSFTFDADGDLWLCNNDQGLFMWRNRVLTRFDEAPQVARRPCTYLLSDTQGRMWIGFTSGGIAVFERGAFRLYGPGEGLAEGSVAALHQTKNGAIWVAAAGGITRIQNGQLTTVSRRNGLPDKVVPSIVEDDEGSIWLGVESGASLIRFSATEMDEVASDPSHQLIYRVYDRSDGLQGPVLHLHRPTAVKARDGRLWFVSGRGVAVIDLRDLQAPPRAALPRIENVVVDGKEHPLQSGLRLSPRTQTLQIDYAALSLSSSSKLRFRYQLEGHNRSWVEAGGERRVSYTNLPPGSYRFRVTATSDGLWRGPEAVLGFVVLPPFYKTYWFSGLCLAGGLGLLWTFQRLRLRAVRNEYALILAERARVSRDIHDTLLQSLGAFNLQLEVVARQLGSSQPSATGTIQHLRSQVAECIQEARRSIWDLRSPRLEAHDLVEAFRRMASDAAPVTVEVTTHGRVRRCAPHVEDQLLKIGQEAIGNAIRHGHATRVDVTLDYRRGALALHISDNGCGFDPEAHVEAIDGHWGLKNMRERAENIGGRLGIISRPGSGTSIELLAPL